MRTRADNRFSAAFLAGALLLLSFSGSAQQAPRRDLPDVPTGAPLPRILGEYKEVTAARLKSPEPGNWLQIRGTYSGWGYSPLDQITPKNVSALQLAWVFSTGAGSAHEAAP